MKSLIVMLLSFVFVIYACQKSESKVVVTPNNSFCDTTQVSYKNDIAPIINKYCNSCHGGNNPNVGNIDFSKYAQISPLAADSPFYIYNVVCYNNRFKKMPPPPAIRLDSCEILKILAWTNRKAPNN